MSDAVKSSRINIFMNEDDHLAKIQRLETAYANLNNKLQGLTAAGLEGTKIWEATNTKLQETQAKLNQVTKEHELGTLSIKKSQAAVLDYQNQIKNFTGSAEEVAKMKARYTEMTAELQRMKVEAGLAAEKVGEIGIAGEATKFLKEQFFELIGPLAAAAGAAELLKDGFEEFNDTQLAVAMLRNTLSNIHQEGYMGELATQTEKLREQFNYLSEKDIAKAQDKLVTFGHLSKNQIAELMPVIVNLAAKLGIDLPSATDKLLGAIEKPLKEFKELGIDMKSGTTIAERYGIVMEQIAPKVKGAAETFANSNKGFWAGVGTNISEMYVAVGRFITQEEEASIKLANLDKQQGDAGQKLIGRYEELSKKTNATTAEKQELKKVETDLVSIFGDSVIEIDKETGAMKINVEKTKEMITQKLLFANGKAVEEASKYKAALDENTESTTKFKAILSAAGLTEAEYHKQLDVITEKRSRSSRTELLNAADLSIAEKKIESLSNSLQPLEKNMLKTQATIDESTGKLKELGFEADAVGKLLSGSGDRNKALTPDVETDSQKAARLAKEAKAAEAAQKMKDGYQKLMDSIAELDKSATGKQIAEVQKRYDELLVEARKYVTNKAELLALEKSLTAKEQDEIGKIILKANEDLAKKEKEQFDKRSTEEYQQSLRNAKAVYDGKKKLLDDDFVAGKLTQEQYDTALVNLQEEKYNQETVLAQDYASTVNAAQDDISKFEAAAADKRVKIHKAELDQKQADADEAEKARKKLHKEEEKAVEESIKYTEQGMAVIEKITQANTNKKLKAADEEYKAEKSKLDKELKAKQITQKQYDDQLAAYDADLKKKKDAIALKQFKEDQDMAIAKTIMNAGVAIMKIWAADNVDTPLAIIQSALVSGVAVGELATIEAQQPPSYATGTEYINGPGTGTSDSIWARVSKGERIVPAAINAELGGISNVDLPKLNYAAVMNAMRSNTTALNGGGGFVSNTTAAQGNNDLMASLHKSISQLNEHIANGIVAHTEIGQHNEAVYKYNKLVARSGAVNKVVMDYDKG